MIGGLQGENGDLNNKYLKKKNLKVSVANIWKHTGGFRRHARWLWNFASWRSPFRSQGPISQRSPCDFTATKLAFSLVWLASNGYNFFISTPIRAPFEALDSWLPELHIVWMKWTLGSAQNVSNSCCPL